MKYLIIVAYLLNSPIVNAQSNISNFQAAQSIEVPWHSLTRGRVIMGDGSVKDLEEYRRSSIYRLSYFVKADEYIVKARYSFWLGVGAAVLAGIADENKKKYLRTAAIGSWGLLWTSWIGYGALAQAEMDDASITLETPNYTLIGKAEGYEIPFFVYTTGI